MSTSTDYRTRELAKRDRQAARRTGRTDKQANLTAFRIGLGIGLVSTKGTK